METGKNWLNVHEFNQRFPNAPISWAGILGARTRIMAPKHTKLYHEPLSCFYRVLTIDLIIEVMEARIEASKDLKNRKQFLPIWKEMIRQCRNEQ